MARAAFFLLIVLVVQKEAHSSPFKIFCNPSEARYPNKPPHSKPSGNREDAKRSAEDVCSDFAAASNPNRFVFLFFLGVSNTCRDRRLTILQLLLELQPQ